MTHILIVVVETRKRVGRKTVVTREERAIPIGTDGLIVVAISPKLAPEFLPILRRRVPRKWIFKKNPPRRR